MTDDVFALEQEALAKPRKLLGLNARRPGSGHRPGAKSDSVAPIGGHPRHKGDCPFYGRYCGVRALVTQSLAALRRFPTRLNASAITNSFWNDLRSWS